MDGKSLADWATDSAAGHAVSSSPSGPYTLTSLPLMPTEDPQGWDGGSIHGVYLIENPKPWANR
jgi:hypothetical protein